MADSIAWSLSCEGIRYLLHYLDDFLFLRAPCSDQGQKSLTTALHLLDRLGVPVASHKTEGPTTSLTFLGILVNTDTFELWLPADKLAHIQETVRQWIRRQSYTRKELESLVGHLSHPATVVTHGRVFLCQLFLLLSLDHAQHHFIRINTGARADLMWWHIFLQDWNGTSFFPTTTTTVEVISDASGSFSCGAFTTNLGWFQLRWPDSWQPVNIAAKELVPIVIATALWGHHWTGTGVCFRSDNMAVVSILNTRTSHDRLLMHLVCCLTFYAAYFRFHVQAAHIPGVLNTAADAISQNNIPLFLSLVPHTQQVPIPQTLVDLLVTHRPNWGSQAWTRLLANSLNRALPHQPGQSTAPDGPDT